jgi:hypothetical protein
LAKTGLELHKTRRSRTVQQTSFKRKKERRRG